MTIKINEIQVEIEKFPDQFKIKQISGDDLFCWLLELSKEKNCTKFMNKLCTEVEGDTTRNNGNLATKSL